MQSALDREFRAKSKHVRACASSAFASPAFQTVHVGSCDGSDAVVRVTGAHHFVGDASASEFARTRRLVDATIPLVSIQNDPVNSMPASSIFRFIFQQRDESQARVELPLRPEFLQGEARVHGGILATLADTCAVYLAIPRVPEDRMLTSIEFKLNFVRPAVLERGNVVARASVVRFGRQVVLIDVDVLQSDALVAKGLFTYLLVDRGHLSPRARATPLA